MIFAVELERCMASIYILCIIICKFHYGQESCLVILLSIDKYLEVGLHRAVLPLGLAFCLRRKSNKKLLFNVKK